MTINSTHDVGRKSWVSGANAEHADFPLQNLPHGVYQPVRGAPRGCVAIGDQVLDMQAAVHAGLFAAGELSAAAAAAESQLNRLMGVDRPAFSALRVRLQALLELNAPDRERVEPCLIPLDQAQLCIPARPGAFTDFMTSASHIAAERPARQAGTVPACFWHLPIAYNSRASSVTPSGQAVERPHGQFSTDGGVEFGPTRALDYELEFACFVGQGNPLGSPIRLDDSADHIFGYCILNDWSARDIQLWESVLGPFQAKAFRTTISPWVVTYEAMAPFRQAMAERPSDAPQAPPHLYSDRNQSAGGLGLRLQAKIRTSEMRRAGSPAAVLTDTTLATAAWSFEQMLTHHAAGGCNLETSDLISSGTLSGPELSSAGCLLEITGGRVPITLPNGERRLYLEDHDEVIISARAERKGYASIGFGECVAQVAPAVAW